MLTRWRVVLGAAVAVVVLASVPCCRKNAPTAPQCERVPGVSEQAVGNAGCLIVVADGVVFVKDRESGGLGVPGGHQEPGETAACTASRETWEETGLRVRVGRLLVVHSNGFHIFACEAVNPIDPNKLSVPSWRRDEIASVKVLDPTRLDASQWRYPEYRKEVIALVASAAATVTNTMTAPLVVAGDEGGSTAPPATQTRVSETSSPNNKGQDLSDLCKIDPDACLTPTDEQIAACGCNKVTGRERQKCIVDCVNQIRRERAKNR